MTDKEDLERKLMVDYLQTRAKYFNEDVGNLDKVDGYDCPKCKNKGAIAVLGEHDNKFALDIVMCDCTKIRKTIQLMKQSGLEEMLGRKPLKQKRWDFCKCRWECSSSAGRAAAVKPLSVQPLLENSYMKDGSYAMRYGGKCQHSSKRI